MHSPSGLVLNSLPAGTLVCWWRSSIILCVSRLMPSRRTPHVPDRRDSSWSIRARPECRAPSYRPDCRCGSRRASACAVLGIVSDFQRLLHGFSYRQHRAKDLLLKDAHITIPNRMVGSRHSFPLARCHPVPCVAHRSESAPLLPISIYN